MELAFCGFQQLPGPDKFRGENSQPAGMTSMAGPGNTIIAMPISTTEKPIVPMISLFACLAVLFIKSFMDHPSRRLLKNIMVIADCKPRWRIKRSNDRRRICRISRSGKKQANFSPKSRPCPVVRERLPCITIIFTLPDSFSNISGILKSSWRACHIPGFIAGHATFGSS